jgi:hypothetical protein
VKIKEFGFMAEENDTPTTLTLDEVNEKYVSKEQMEATMKARLAKATNGRFKPDELLDNEDFLSRLVTERGDKLTELMQVTKTLPSADRIKQEILKTQVEPLQQTLEAEKKSKNSLLARVREGSLRKVATEVGLHEDMIDILNSHYAAKVKYSDEHGDFYLVDNDGEFVFRTGGKDANGSPFKSIQDDLSEIKAAGKYGAWFKSTARDGIGLKSTKSGTGAVSLAEFEKMTIAEKVALANSDMETFKALSNEEAKSTSDRSRKQ